jgi:hypothetical protein
MSRYPAEFHVHEKDLYETGNRRLHPIGQKAITPSGEIFRYSEMGAVVGVANNLYQSSLVVSDWLTQEHATDLIVGDTTITFYDGGTAFKENEAAGGTILAEETADLGHVYLVKSNIATVSQNTVMNLEDGVAVVYEVLDATSNVLTFIKNPWMDVLISPAQIVTHADVAPVAGIFRVIVAKDAFGWIQTRGVASCLIETDATAGALLLGNAMRAANEVAGAVSVVNETDVDASYQIVGYALGTAPTADFGHVFLQIE